MNNVYIIQLTTDEGRATLTGTSLRGEKNHVTIYPHTYLHTNTHTHTHTHKQ